MSPNSMPPSSASPYLNDQENNQQHQNLNSVFTVAQQILEDEEVCLVIDDNFEKETYLDSEIKMTNVESKLQPCEIMYDVQSDLIKTITFDTQDYK